MSLRDISKSLAEKFESDILRFADHFKTRRVYVVKWVEDKNFRISVCHKNFTFNDRRLAYDMCRYINNQQGVLNARVKIFDFKNIVDLSLDEIERLRYFPNFNEVKSLWETFHECCCCGRIAPVVHNCTWMGKKARACEDCLHKYARFNV